VKTTEQRFWEKVDKSGGPNACWLWTAYRLPAGYGTFGGDERRPDGTRKTMLAHRYALISSGVLLRADQLARHVVCDNPPCCNPAHLKPGSYLDNNRDAVDKGRNAIGNRHGSRTKPASRPRGAKHGRSKINEATAIAVIRAGKARTPPKEIAGAHGISPRHVRAILQGRFWSHLDRSVL